MKRVSALLFIIALPILTGQSGCPFIGAPPAFRPLPQVSVNNNEGSLRAGFSVDLSLYPDTQTINWDFGDGSVVTRLTPASGRSVMHEYDEPGDYFVRVFLFTDSRLLATVRLPIIIVGPNQVPEAAFTVEDLAGPETSSLGKRFDAGGSTDPDGEITEYEWNFGDGMTATGETVEHTYASAGRFAVTLTVRDDRDAFDTATQNVPATTPPTAQFSFTPGGAEAPQLLTVAFDASASSDDDGSVASYAWDFGDGDTGSGQTPSHAYDFPGVYNVLLTVTDNLGVTNQVMLEVSILGTQPFLISADPDTGEVSTTVRITALVGVNFDDAATIRLRRAGELDIAGSSIDITGSTQAAVSFNLNGAELGDWDVVLRNPNGDEAALTAGFRIVSKNRARIRTSEGDIVLELDPAAAPGHVANYFQYVEDEFYDGQLFHRVVANFVIQAGAFMSLGEGADPRLQQVNTRDPIQGEAPNGLTNVRGTIALALRGQDEDSGTAQFFINLRDNPGLDTGPPRFTVFGRVIEGLDVVDRIGAVQTGTFNVLLPNDQVQSAMNIPVEDVTIFSIRRE